MNNKKNILYIISGETGFKKTDENILKSIGTVRKFDYKSKWTYLNLKILLNVICCHTIVIWFASIHAVPVILLNYFFNRRLIIIAGGFDVANELKINYGAMRGKSRAILGKWILARANSVIAVSKSNYQEIIENGIEFIIEPYIRFKGLAGEQATMFFKDPAGNALEFKSFKDFNQIFEK